MTTKKELISMLEGYRCIITNPNEYTIEELESMLTKERKINAKKGVKICPRCGDIFIFHALSRLDNKTEICSACGNWESMIDYRFLSSATSVEGINDRLNCLGTLKGVQGVTNNHEYLYYQRIEANLNNKLQDMINGKIVKMH